MTTISDFFRNHGYYHGKSKFPVELIQKFKDEFDPVFDSKRERFYARFSQGTNYAANHDINRWNMLLPSDSLMMKSSFFAEDEIFEALTSVFEEDFALVFFSSDISSPGSAFQTIHQDGNDFAVALNIPLVNSNEENGATHIYPDTHRTSESAAFTNESNEFTDREVIERAHKMEPVSLNVSIGDYTLRDLRLIHRGTPNHTKEHRPYLSAIFLPSSHNEAPTFETIRSGLDAFKMFKEEAFPTGRMDLIDYANTFGRLVMGFSQSDRIQRPISKAVSDRLSDHALYCLRFACFEDEILNKRITRNSETSNELKKEIELAKEEFERLKSKKA